MKEFLSNIPHWVVVPVFLLTWVVFGLAIKKIFFRRIKTLSKKTDTQLDDIIVKAADWPISLLVIVSGVSILLRFFIPENQMGEITRYVIMGMKISIIVAIVVFLDKLFRYFMRVYSGKYELLRVSSGMMNGVVRTIVIVLGALVLIDSMGVSITPILASLGIGSLAVALALQPTLENFFSGFQLILDRPIKPGHFIQLESGEEGYVEKIGWRSTWVRQLGNNTIVIPNKQLVNSRVLNYYYPSRRLSVLIQVGVHYASDLKKVERVTIEVGNEIMKKVQGGIPDSEPFIRYHTFDSSSINFTVILKAKEFVDNYLIKHEFIKALSERYNKEGINIPFPIMALNTDQEKPVFKN